MLDTVEKRKRAVKACAKTRQKSLLHDIIEERMRGQKQSYKNARAKRPDE